MSLHLFRRIRRLVLVGLFASVAPLAAQGGDSNDDNDFALSELITTCNFDRVTVEELCGSVTHDSCPMPILPKQRVVTELESEETPQDSKSSDLSIASLAATLISTAGVKVQQVVEPFAMVGPSISGSLESVQKLHAWWDTALAVAAQSQPETEAELIDSQRETVTTGTELAVETTAEVDNVEISLQKELEAVASLEPVDAQQFGASVLVTPNAYTAIEVTPLDPLVGSSVVIATIQDEYLPYDLSARDLKLWSVFPTAARPFCVRSRFDTGDSDSMWDVVEVQASDPMVDQSATTEVVSVEPPQDSADDATDDMASVASMVKASPECILDEVIWQIGSYADRAPWAKWSTPDSIGRQLAKFVSRGKRFAAGAVGVLASTLPKRPQEESPSTSGEKLLARAGAAVEVGPTVAAKTEPLYIPAVDVDVTELQIAEVPAFIKVR